MGCGWVGRGWWAGVCLEGVDSKKKSRGIVFHLFCIAIFLSFRPLETPRAIFQRISRWSDTANMLLNLRRTPPLEAQPSKPVPTDGTIGTYEPSGTLDGTSIARVGYSGFT